MEGIKNLAQSKKKKKEKHTPPLRVEATLKQIYENPSNPASFSSPLKVFKAAKKIQPKITLQIVKDWLSGQRAYTLYRPVISKFRRRKVLTRGLYHQYQADLLDFHQLKWHNRGTWFILTVIDCFSRFACAIPIKNKRGETVRDAFLKVFRIMKVPKKMQTDNGTEFYNSFVKGLFNQLKIIHFSTDQELKASIVERFNRTLRDKIQKYIIAKKSLAYIDALPEILDGYNSSPHRTLEGHTPKSVTKKTEAKIYDILYSDYLSEKKKRHKYKLNDVVRVCTVKETINKKMHKTFKDEFHSVTNVIDSIPPTYQVMRLKDKELVPGAYYEQQMQKISQTE